MGCHFVFHVSINAENPLGLQQYCNSFDAGLPTVTENDITLNIVLRLLTFVALVTSIGPPDLHVQVFFLMKFIRDVWLFICPGKSNLVARGHKRQRITTLVVRGTTVSYERLTRTWHQSPTIKRLFRIFNCSEMANTILAAGVFNQKWPHQLSIAATMEI